MSANLDVSKGKVAFWSNGVEAWHSKGQVTEGYKDSEEILTLSGLDFDVVKEPIYLGNGEVIKDQFATVRKDTDKALGVVGSRYVVTPNISAFKFFDTIIGEEDITYQTAGALRDGKIIYVSAKLNTGMLVNGKDPHDLYINFYNTHDGSGSIKAYPTITRVVCNNTLSASLYDNKKNKRGMISVRHTSNQNIKLSQAKDILKISKEVFEEKKMFLEDMSRKSISSEVSKELVLQLICDYAELDKIGKKEDVDKVLSTRKYNIYSSIVNSIENGVGQQDLGDNALKFINGITYYTSNKKDKTSEDTIYNTFFGSSLALQEQALQLVANY